MTAKAQIRLVLEAFRDGLPTENFRGRTKFPKTLIFLQAINKLKRTGRGYRNGEHYNHVFSGAVPPGAMRAGLDGVELHAANGYLFDLVLPA